MILFLKRGGRKLLNRVIPSILPVIKAKLKQKIKVWSEILQQALIDLYEISEIAKEFLKGGEQVQ